MHRLADDVFPQHRPERGAPVAPAGEPRLPCPFQLDVDAIAGRRDLLAEQDRAAIAEHGEVAELVTGVRLRDRSAAFGQGIAGEDRGAFRALERVRLEPKHGRQRPVERDEPRLANRSWRRMRVEELRQLRVGVLEAPACHGDDHTGDRSTCRRAMGELWDAFLTQLLIEGGLPDTRAFRDPAVGCDRARLRGTDAGPARDDSPDARAAAICSRRPPLEPARPPPSPCP